MTNLLFRLIEHEQHATREVHRREERCIYRVSLKLPQYDQSNESLICMTSFGVPAVLLEMVPVAGIIFAFTNTCGAALWAADMERSIGAESTQK